MSRKKPAAIKKLEGNRGKREINDGPAYGEISTDPPDYLNADGIQKWNERLGVLLDVDGLVTQADYDLLGQYCQAYQLYVEALGIVEEDGLISIAQSGAPYQNPAVGMANKSSDLMMKIGIKFGWNPVDRQSIQVPEKMKDALRKFAG